MKGTIYQGNGDSLDYIDISESNLRVRANTDGERKKRKHDNEWGEVPERFPDPWTISIRSHPVKKKT